MKGQTSWSVQTNSSSIYWSMDWKVPFDLSNVSEVLLKLLYYKLVMTSKLSHRIICLLYCFCLTQSNTHYIILSGSDLSRVNHTEVRTTNLVLKWSTTDCMVYPTPISNLAISIFSKKIWVPLPSTRKGHISIITSWSFITKRVFYWHTFPPQFHWCCYIPSSLTVILERNSPYLGNCPQKSTSFYNFF